MDNAVANVQRDEIFFVNYYDNIPYGDKGDFMLVLRNVFSGGESRWYKRFAAWRKRPVKRRLKQFEIDKLTHLTTNERWRETLRIYQRLTTL